MILEQYYLGCLAHASYLLGDEASSTAIIVDPQRDIEHYIAVGRPRPARLARVDSRGPRRTPLRLATQPALAASRGDACLSGPWRRLPVWEAAFLRYSLYPWRPTACAGVSDDGAQSSRGDAGQPGFRLP
jgi:hypothetical protein